MANLLRSSAIDASVRDADNSAVIWRKPRNRAGPSRECYVRSGWTIGCWGPLEVLDDDGREVVFRPGRQRALLALLILRANELVASEVLVEELWGESPPPTALKMLRNQVSALRRVLGAERPARDAGQRLPAAACGR